MSPMKTTFRILANGWAGVRRQTGMILGLWAATSLLALLAAAPAASCLLHEFGHSLSETGVGKINLMWLADLQLRYREVFSLLPQSLLIPILLFILFWIFLSGGIIGRLASGERATLESFFTDAGRLFLRFLAILLISIPAYAIAFGGVFTIVRIPLKIWARHASSELPVLLASVIEAILLLLILSIVQMFIDYVKVRTVLGCVTSPLRALEETLDFLGGKFFRAWLLYLLVSCFSVAAATVFLTISQILPESLSGTPALGFIWAQAYIVLRIALKALCYATEIQFMRSNETP
jgi:hypothetical protein